LNTLVEAFIRINKDVVLVKASYRIRQKAEAPRVGGNGKDAP